MMRTSDFDFILPEELIAKYPLARRSESRLLCLDGAGSLSHKMFADLPHLLKEDDVLVFNNTRVMPARLSAKKMTGGTVEILIERILEDNVALAHIKSNKSLRLPCSLILADHIEIVVTEKSTALFKIQFKSDVSIGELLHKYGSIPLPNYIQRAPEQLDYDRYQTVYASKEGAIAAPTAGLHFDEALLQNIRAKQIEIGFITLHVGAGTFKPVRVESIKEHCMHQEYFELNSEICDLIAATKNRGGRVIAVGTTTVRALETVWQKYNKLRPCAEETQIFIYPGYEFKVIDALITNFHLPRSTLIMLVCAFGGYKEVISAYQAAIIEKYRFYSYGDAMFISRKLART